MSDIKLRIPVKPRTRAFLIHNFGNKYTLKLDDFLGSFLYILLRNQQKIRDNSKGNYLAHYSSEYIISISESYVFERAVDTFMTVMSKLRFNSYFEGIYILNLRSAIHSMLEYSPKTINHAIELYHSEFLSDINTYEDMETVRKNYQRFRNKNEKAKLKLFDDPFAESKKVLIDKKELDRLRSRIQELESQSCIS